MTERSSVQKKLKKILNSQEFNLLVPYQDPKTWRTMTAGERELLGQLFVLNGQRLLKRGDSKSGLKSFNLAAKAAPKSADVFFHKGIAYSRQGRSVRSLSLACRAFEKATQLEPHFFDAWYSWAHAILSCAYLKDEPEQFYEAHDKFVAAEKFVGLQEPKFQAKFYWEWGRCWYVVASFSGEAYDLSQAIDKFDHAAKADAEFADFWNDFANAIADQARLLNRPDQFIKAADFYKRAVELDPQNLLIKFNLGCCFSQLFEIDLDKKFFDMACEAFSEASIFYKEHPDHLLQWGKLLLSGGRLWHDESLLCESIIKFDKFLALCPEHPMALCLWGVALVYLGAKGERLDYLKEAEQKIVHSLAIDPEFADGWYYYGRCLAELGHYFRDVRYHLQAIEKYENGAELDSKSITFDYGMATAYYAIAELTDNFSVLESSFKCFAKICASGQRLPPQVMLDWGKALMKYGEVTQQRSYLDDALEKFEQSIALLGNVSEQDPLLLESLFHYACTLDSLGHSYEDPSYHEKAIQLLSYLVHTNPDIHEARYRLGIALVHLGELVSEVDCFYKAIEHFEEIVRQDPENDVAWDEWGIALMNLAHLLYDSACPEHSEECYKLAEAKLLNALSLGNVLAYYNLACFYALTNNNHAAMHYLEQGLQLGVLPSIDEMMHDEWLSGVRNTHEFRQFLSRLLRNSH